MLLQVLYIDLSGTTNYNVKSYQSKWLTKKEFVERIESDTLVAPGLVKDIGDLEDAYSEDMLDRLLSWKLPLNLCPNNLFSEIVHSIIDGSYDEEKYRYLLATEYKKRI